MCIGRCRRRDLADSPVPSVPGPIFCLCMMITFSFRRCVWSVTNVAGSLHTWTGVSSTDRRFFPVGTTFGWNAHNSNPRRAPRTWSVYTCVNMWEFREFVFGSSTGASLFMTVVGSESRQISCVRRTNYKNSFFVTYVGGVRSFVFVSVVVISVIVGQIFTFWRCCYPARAISHFSN